MHLFGYGGENSAIGVCDDVGRTTEPVLLLDSAGVAKYNTGEHSYIIFSFLLLFTLIRDSHEYFNWRKQYQIYGQVIITILSLNILRKGSLV